MRDVVDRLIVLVGEHGNEATGYVKKGRIFLLLCCASTTRI